jgi:hypothetical protein
MAIDEMGLTKRNLDVMTKIIHKPYGLILAGEIGREKKSENYQCASLTGVSLSRLNERPSLTQIDSDSLNREF